jgi:hypothetical protein
MKILSLAMFVLAPLVVGCASTKEITVRGKLAPPGSVAVAPTTTVVVPQQQYRSAPVVEVVDPLVLQARAIALQEIKDREIWKAACYEYRRINKFRDYDDCRALFGDEPGIDHSYHYGRSLGGSVMGNSRGVIWK